MSPKEQQFTRLVQEQKATIYSVCLMFADERTEVDDLVQDALIHLWEGFDSFEGRSDIKSWVYRVINRNRLSSHCHKCRYWHVVCVLWWWHR